MNSTIQQLYMIPSFRRAVLEVEDKSLNTVPKEDNILYQLKVTSCRNIFSNMLNSVYSQH